ncbi:MAG: sigma-54-dependent Fis family transcriptional regulator [Planctomycetales bacterium]|nr:sigma-54-dependent Fis family transcriptional regulator [Planctomycetales bacterium]
MRLLFADDEKSLQNLMSRELVRMGHEVTVCPDGEVAIAALERNTYDCILVDLDMPKKGGIDVIAKAKELSPDTDSIVMTGKSSLETAISALRHGTFDYITKPCKLADLDRLLSRVAAKRELTNKYRALKRQLERIEGESRLVGDSSAMDKVRTMISKVAPTNSNVLILGETGTGKELAARSVHDQSLRADMPFVAVNCGALPESLIESELFGHRKGAFTGADEQRIGLFEVASGGTIFLDEIGELPMSMQSKLLRVLESGEIRRVGDNEAFTVDVRVICATHRPLEQMVAEDQFREDLMFRINTFEVQLPPLRERSQDIPELARHLLARIFGDRQANLENAIAPDALDLLTSHVWPGNVRELANVIEHATILCEELPICPEHLPNRFDARKLREPITGRSSGPLTLKEIEQMAIEEALERHSGNKPKAAEELGISLKTLYNKLNQVETSLKAA